MERQDLAQEIMQLKLDNKDIQREVRDLATRVTVSEREIMSINKTLDKISANTTWILRIIVSAIVVGLLSLIIKGG